MLKILKNLNIEASDAPEMMVTYYQNKEGDAVVINSNFAIDAGINPKEDAIANGRFMNQPYVNIIAVRSGDENR